MFVMRLTIAVWLDVKGLIRCVISKTSDHELLFSRTAQRNFNSITLKLTNGICITKAYRTRDSFP